MSELHSRRGFTAIELMVVLGVMIVLGAMTMPTLLTAMRRGKVNEAANAIVQVGSQARRLARREGAAPGADYYGVVVVNQGASGPGYAALTYGPTATTADVLMEGGKPVSKITFSPNVVVYDGATPMADGAAISSWMYQYRTGEVIQAASPTASPVPILGMSMRTVDGKMRTGVSLYSIGMVHVDDR